MVRVAICALEAPPVEDTALVCMPGDDKVEMVPVLRTGVSLGDFQSFFKPGVGVCYAATVVVANFQQLLSLHICLAYAMTTKVGGPSITVGYHSSIEVFHKV